MTPFSLKAVFLEIRGHLSLAHGWPLNEEQEGEE